MDSRQEMIQKLRGQILAAGASASSSRAGVSTALPLFDAFASPNGRGLANAAIHEVLADVSDGTSVDVIASLLACSGAAARQGGWIVWSDPAGELYPPALQQCGVSLERLLILRPKSAQDELWAIAECMRCPGVAATVANVGRLTPVQARRLQLAAEQGGGIGVLIRPDDVRATNYAAATRWRVLSFASNDVSHRASNGASREASRAVAQRWQIELAYGHGGRVGQRFVLEVDRETGRAFAVPAPDLHRAATGTAPAAAEDSLHRAADLAERSGRSSA